MTYPQENKSSNIGRAVTAVMVLAVLGGIATLGWMWLSDVEVTEVKITGYSQASPDSLAALARVEPGESLYDVKPAFVKDRVQRHPWVESAHITRLPTGTLNIDVKEREPVLLMMGGNGESFYIDANGFQMPRESGYVNVPILTGDPLEYKPLKPVDNEKLLSFLGHLADSDLDEIISEVQLSDEGISLYTVSGENHAAIPVTLGRGDLEEKLSALRLFWTQAVQGQPEKRIKEVDLRFAGQVVVQEEDIQPDQ